MTLPSPLPYRGSPRRQFCSCAAGHSSMTNVLTMHPLCTFLKTLANSATTGLHLWYAIPNRQASRSWANDLDRPPVEGFN
jgi:hypothetical protein